MGEHVFESMSDEDLEQAIGSAAGRVAREQCRFLLLAAEVERRGLWAGWGMPSAAAWLSWRCALDPVTAREHLRVGRALTALPRIRRAFEEGRLSYSKVRAVTRVATPEDDATWADAAADVPAGQLVEVVRGYRKATSAKAAPEPGVRWRWDDDGMLVLSARLAADQGQVVLAALRQADDALREAVDPAEAPTIAEALTLVAQASLAVGPRAPTTEEHAVVLHVAADRVHLEDGPGVPDEVARRLTCDATVRAAVHGLDGQVLGVGRRTRRIGGALRRTVLARDDRQCRYPGCRNRRWLQVHHVVHWADGGRTDPDNLVTLCSWHHRTLHDGAFTMTPEFRRPDGTLIAVPEVELGAPAASPPPDRIAGEWDGSRLDLDWAVEVLASSAVRRGSQGRRARSAGSPPPGRASRRSLPPDAAVA